MLLLVTCFLLAPLLRALGRMPEATPAVLSGWILHVALPATVLRHVPSMPWDPALAFVLVAPWLGWGLAWGVGRLAGRVWGWPPALTACVVLLGGLGNTSFVGLPVTEAFHGAPGIPVALMYDQFGSFVALSSVGLLTAARGAGLAADPGKMLRRVVAFPPFVALAVALLLRPAPELLAGVGGLLARLSDTLAPLALFCVGYQLRLQGIREDAGPLALALAVKLVLAPALILGLALGLGLRGLVPQVAVLEAGMAPMITAGIVATEHGLRPALAARLVALGIPLSFLTLAAWHGVGLLLLGP